MDRQFKYKINGVKLAVYDDEKSLSTTWVSIELRTDSYHLERCAFQPGDVVIDIGGHVGMTALYIAKKWPGVKVHSFEPSTQNYDRFTKNLSADNQEVTVDQTAITADGRDLYLAHAYRNTGGISAFRDPEHKLIEFAHSITLQGIFDKYQIDRAKLLKIDCEGAEHEILTTAPVELLRRIDYLTGEFHINHQLEAQGWSIRALADYCASVFPKHHFSYQACAMQE